MRARVLRRCGPEQVAGDGAHAAERERVHGDARADADEQRVLAHDPDGVVVVRPREEVPLGQRPLHLVRHRLRDESHEEENADPVRREGDDPKDGVLREVLLEQPVAETEDDQLPRDVEEPKDGEALLSHVAGDQVHH